MSQLIPTIGIETHVQLSTKTKLFCSCSNDATGAQPNTLICPVCVGLPGSLPVLNQRAIELAIRAGLALKGEIPQLTKFDRKNYFYPDLPKGYQITQFDQPVVGPGRVEINADGETVTVGIVRAHLEEDAGKLVHPAGVDYSLVDLNRAGTPLLEIVSEPDMHTPAQAKAYAQEIYNLMRYAGVSTAELSQGNMRFDVNVSVAAAGQLGTRTETKNLNSFRAVERAVAFEVQRQTEVIGDGQTVIQETRGWDESKGVTVAQRSKEEAHDYRYFPEPDLPPIIVNDQLRQDSTQDFVTPGEVRAQLDGLGLKPSQVEILVNDPTATLSYLKDIDTKILAKPAEQALVAKALEQNPDLRLAYAGLDSHSRQSLVKLAQAVDSKSISATMFNQALPELLAGKDISDHLSSTQISDSGELDKIVAEVINDNPKAVADYQAGQEQAHKFLVGQVMKATRGQANAAMVNDILKSQLAK